MSAMTSGKEECGAKATWKSTTERKFSVGMVVHSKGIQNGIRIQEARAQKKTTVIRWDGCECFLGSVKRAE
jgi:hypothetical protein